MRLISLIIAAALIAPTPAAAAWKEYPQPQLGFVVQFPAPPAVSSGTYKTVLVPSANTHIYSLKDENALFIASVVDLMDRREEGASLMIEAEFNLGLLGDITANSTSRVEPGSAAIFGRFITIDCRSGRVPDQPGQDVAARSWFKNITGAACPDGARLTVNMFFNRGRLYMMQGMNLPTKEDTSFGPSALRFTNSISFYAADGTRNAADEVK